jgi:nitric oxide dioxygenase
MLQAVKSDTPEFAAGEGKQRAWVGWRPLVVDARERESEFVTSFYLKPAGALPVSHRPGQHLTLRLDIPGRPAKLKRSYSISGAPNAGAYRISVKREAMGLASNWLHRHAESGTIIEAMAPQGTFVLPKCPKRPIVFLSGGVGITPLMSMLEALADSTTVPVHFVHSTANRSTHNFGERVQRIALANARISQSVFYSRPSPGDVQGTDYDRAGRIDMAWLTENTPLLEADVFLCGPRPFMRRFAVGLTKAGLPRRQLHTEFFGPVEDLFDDAVDFEQPLASPIMHDAPRKVAQAETGHGFGFEDIGRTLMQSAADAVIASDRAGHVVHWNAGAERIFGYRADEAIGRTLDLIIPEQFRERHWQGYRAVIESGISRYGEGDTLAVPGRHKDGHRISLEFTIAPMRRPDGTIAGMVATMRDVTRRFEEVKALRKRIAELGGDA